MSKLARMILDSPEVRAYVEREVAKHEAARREHAEALASYATAVERLATRMMLGGHWS